MTYLCQKFRIHNKRFHPAILTTVSKTNPAP